MSRAVGILLGLSMVLPTAALSCSVAVITEGLEGVVDLPISVAADCSFQNGSHNDMTYNVWAHPATNLGQGTVTQILNHDNMCLEQERMLVLDCKTGRGALINGSWDDRPDHPITARNTVAAILAPRGPVTLEPGADPAMLSRQAATLGGFTTTDLSQPLSVGKNNRFDPWCGCNLFYPGLMEKSK